MTAAGVRFGLRFDRLSVTERFDGLSVTLRFDGLSVTLGG